MSTRTLTISFATDGEDFISRACPECGERFKIRLDEGEATVSFCPFCGRSGSRWETQRQLEYAKAFAAKQVLEPELAKLDQAFRNLGSATGGMVKVTGKMSELRVPPKPVEQTDDLQYRALFHCCSQVVRHGPQTIPRYCIACGTERADSP